MSIFLRSTLFSAKFTNKVGATQRPTALSNLLRSMPDFVQRKTLTELAFSSDKPSLKKNNEYLKKIEHLDSSIKKTETELKQLQNNLQSCQSEYEQFKAPFARSKKAYQDIEDLVKIIIDGINQSLLDGTLNFQYSPKHGYNHELIKFFEPILAAYGISYKIESSRGWNEFYEYLQFSFDPEHVKTALPFRSNNNKYNEWLNVFDKKITAVFQQSKEPKKLDAPLIKSDAATSSRCQVCSPAAFLRLQRLAQLERLERSEWLAEDTNLSNNQHDSILTADKKTRVEEDSIDSVSFAAGM